MKKVKIEELDIEKFLPFGFYVNLINPDTEKLGASPIEFFRDMIQWTRILPMFLIVLPERVYANDCRAFKLENKIKIEI